MAQRVIDFRSDTVTRPGPEMRQAMAEAPVGDDVFGDDPTVNLLQERTAELFGKQAGMFVPSGTMSNQAALHTHTRRGDEVFLHAQAHIIYYEQGGAAVLSSLQLRCFDSEDGTLDPAAMEEHVHRDDDVHFARTRVVALEDTHNHCGGLVYPLEKIRAVREFCDKLRPRAASGRRSHLERPRGQRRTAGRHRGAVRLRQRLPVERAWARPSARCWSALPSSSSLPSAPARSSAAACARPASWPPPASMRSITTSSAWPTTTAAAASWPSGWRRCRAWTST